MTSPNIPDTTLRWAAAWSGDASPDELPPHRLREKLVEAAEDIHALVLAVERLTKERDDLRALNKRNHDVEVRASEWRASELAAAHADVARLTKERDEARASARREAFEKATRVCDEYAESQRRRAIEENWSEQDTHDGRLRAAGAEVCALRLSALAAEAGERKSNG